MTGCCCCRRALGAAPTTTLLHLLLDDVVVILLGELLVDAALSGVYRSEPLPACKMLLLLLLHLAAAAPGVLAIMMRRLWLNCGAFVYLMVEKNFNWIAGLAASQAQFLW